MGILLKNCNFAAVLAFMVLSAPVSAATYVDKHPATLDLTSGTKIKPFEQGNPLPVTALPPAVAAAISAAPELQDTGPGLLQLLDPDDNTARKLEHKTIAAEADAVHRAGKKLSLKTQAGKTVDFVDWQAPESKNADGDKDVYVYAGRVGTGRLYRIEERFEHDAPSNLFINPVNGTVASADYGQGILAVSPDGAHLMAVASNDLMITVTSLGADGPKVELACRYGDGPGLAFKGWHDPGSFDLVLSTSDKPGIIAPVRVSFQQGNWTLASSNAPALAKWKFACRRASK